MTKKQLAHWKRRLKAKKKKSDAAWAKLTPAEKQKIIDLANRLEKKVRSGIG
jgi:hypothetical protein